MISVLTGKVIEKGEKNLIVELGGVGLNVITNRELALKANINEETRIFTYLHVKEDSLTLFGFEQKGQKEFFISLLSVSGVGPKLAMEIMEAPLAHIKEAIDEGNTDALSEVKGLGKKTAQKIILELKGKIPDEELMGDNFYSEEVVFTLINLGFTRKDIFKKLKDLPNNIQNTEEIVRWFLKKD